MGAKILEAIEKKKAELPEIGKRAIEKRCHHILRNFNEIKGRNYSRQQVYRLAGRTEDVHRPGVLEQLFEIFVATAFAPGANSDLIIEEVRSWPGWVRSVVVDQPDYDFWPLAEQANASLSRLRIAYLNGDGVEALAAVAELQLMLDRLRPFAGSMCCGSAHPAVPATTGNAVCAGSDGIPTYKLKGARK